MSKEGIQRSARSKGQAPAARSGIEPNTLAGAAVIAAAACLIYFPALSGGLILDDDNLLFGNPLIKAADGLYRIWFTTDAVDYWPVTNSSYWLEWRLWGMNPTGYHVTNLLLHIVDALLIWAILERLAIAGAFLAALLFAVHPVNVESVAWIIQRKGLLAMLFSLLSILAYLRSQKRSPIPGNRAHRFYWFSLAAFLLAMLSKGSAAMLPAVLFIIVCQSRRPTRDDLARITPFLLVAALLTVVDIWFQTHGAHASVRPAGFIERVLGASAIVWFYLYKALLPVGLSFVYPLWQIDSARIAWWLPSLATLIATAILWHHRDRWSRGALFLWTYFWVALVPVLGFTDIAYMRYSLVADHYQYFAIIGVTAGAAAAWAGWQRRLHEPARWVATGAAFSLVATLSFLSWRQSSLYVNERTLYAATLQRNPEARLAHANLGAALAESGEVGAAMQHYQRALEINPDDAEAHNNLGAALHDAGHLPEAIAHYQKAVQVKPDFVEARNNLGNAFYQSGRVGEAIHQYEQVLWLRPTHAAAHNNLSIALTAQGRMEQAIPHSREALRLKPNYPEAYNSLGRALMQLGKLDEAITQFQQALTIRPEFADARNNLNLALSAKPTATP